MLTRSEIARQRLANQYLTEPTFKKPGEVVRWLGAVQAQDYAAAKWAGVEMAEPELERETVEGNPHWFPAPVRPRKEVSHTAHLLPNYDEYFIGFRDRSAIGEVVKSSKVDAPSNAFSAHVIVIDGQLVGGWKRTLKANAVVVELNPITRLTKAEQQAVAVAAQRYGAFLALQVELV